MCIVLARVWNAARQRAWNDALSSPTQSITTTTPTSIAATEQSQLEDAQGQASDEQHEQHEQQEEDQLAATTDHLDPQYDDDRPAAADSVRGHGATHHGKPVNARLDVRATEQLLGIATKEQVYTEFETWWATYLLQRERERAKLVLQQRLDERRWKVEQKRVERQAVEEAEAAQAAEVEERRKHEEAEAEQRRKHEEAEAEQRHKRKEAEAEAEERRKNEEAEAGAQTTYKEVKPEAEVQVTASSEAGPEEESTTTLGTTPTTANVKLPNDSNGTGTPAGTERSDTSETVTAAPTTTAPTTIDPTLTSAASSATSAHQTEPPSRSSLDQNDRMVRTPSRARTLSPDPSFNSLTAHPTPPGSSPLATPKEDEQAPPLSASHQQAEEQEEEGDSRDDDAPLGSLIGRTTVTTSKLRSSHRNQDDSDSERYGPPSPRAQRSRNATHPVEQLASSDHSKDLDTDTVPAPPTDASRSPVVGPDGHPLKAWFEIRVGDPQTVGAPIGAHTVYTVRTRTDSERFRSFQFSVLRRYSEFRWLHAALVHNHPGVIVPPVPEKIKIGRFQPELVEARRVGLELCINKIANHRVLQHDDDFHLFVSSENFASDVRARDLIKGPVPTPEQRTYLGWGTSLVSVAGAGGPRFVETDEWFEKQRSYLDSLESHLKSIVKMIHLLSENRRDRAQTESDLAKQYAALSTSSLSRATCTCFAGMGETTALAGRTSEVQAEADVRDLGSIIYEYERMVGSVRKAFQKREDAWIAYKRSSEEMTKLLAKQDKQDKGFREDEVGVDRRDLIEKEAEAMHLHNRFEAISRTCKAEVNQFDSDRLADIRVALTAWVQGMIQRQEELVREWQEYAALVARQTGSHTGHQKGSVASQKAIVPPPPAQHDTTTATTPVDTPQATASDHPTARPANPSLAPSPSSRSDAQQPQSEARPQAQPDPGAQANVSPSPEHAEKHQDVPSPTVQGEVDQTSAAATTPNATPDHDLRSDDAPAANTVSDAASAAAPASSDEAQSPVDRSVPSTQFEQPGTSNSANKSEAHNDASDAQQIS